MPTVQPALETPSRFDDDAGGNADADDPAIWVDQGHLWRTVVFGTLKNGGLDAYDRDGQLLQHVDAPAAPADGLEASRFNNVDIAYDVRIGTTARDVAIVTDRGRDRLRFYSINPRGASAGGRVLTDVTALAAPRLFNPTEEAVEDQETGYGLAVRPDPHGGAPWVVVSRRHTTTVGLFHLKSLPGGRLSYAASSAIDLPSTFALAGGGTWSPCEEPGEDPQVEGMVVDLRNDTVYAAQEDVGVWRIPVRGRDLGKPSLVEKVREFGTPASFDPETEECVLEGPVDERRHLSADAEGLAIAYGPHGRALMFASSQGDSTFALYRLYKRPIFVSNLAIGPSSADPTLDGVDHSDGSAVYPGRVGPAFPHGLLVLHDGENTPETTDPTGETRVDTDFKFVRWDRLLRKVLAE